MRLPLEFRLEARDDIDGAFAWYESQRLGLGETFLIELRKALDRIKDSPKLYAVVYRSVRLATMRRFPYLVAYRVKSKRVEVLAVVHGARSENAWRSRLN